MRHLQHVVEQQTAMAVPLAVVQHEEVQHAERVHLADALALVEQEQVLAAHLEQRDHLATPPASRHREL